MSRQPRGQQTDAPPPYHDWMAVPDTALYPPPPSISYEQSPVANASSSIAERAHAWCRANPLWPPQTLSDSQIEGLSICFATPIPPPGLKGKVTANNSRPGIWSIETTSKCEDTCFLSSVPLYSAIHSPSRARNGQVTIYYEIRVLELGPDSGVALGYGAPPQLPWRLPGWEGGTLGVHGDDGRRFVDDSYGGKDFTEPFREGEVVGLGMTFTPREPAVLEKTKQVVAPSSRADVEVFIARDGRRTGQWNLHEEVDGESASSVFGLEGQHDILAAIGAYGPCQIEVRFGRHNWQYRPW